MLESSRESLSPKPRSRVLRRYAWALLAIGIVSLQIYLPWQCIDLSNERDPRSGPVEKSKWLAWLPRLRLDNILSLDRPILNITDKTIASATVCKDELNLLLQTNEQQFSESPVNLEILRVNLSTGKLTTLVAPQKIRHFLSDGERIWWLPQESEGARAPFILDGRPVAMKPIPTMVLLSRLMRARNQLGQPATVPVRYTVQGHIHQIMEFVAEEWSPTDRFAFAPSQYADFSFDVTSEKIFCACRPRLFGNAVWYRTGVDVGTRQRIQSLMADYFSGDEPEDDKLSEIGWRNVFRSKYPYPIVASWSDDDRISELRYSPGEWQQTQGGFMWSRFKATGTVETEYVPLPFRWSYRGYEAQYFRTIRSTGNQMLIVFYNRSDEHLEVLRWDNGRLTSVMQRNRKKISGICVEATSLFVLAVAIPTLLLMAISRCHERPRSQKIYAYGRESVILATAARRGFARAIDLMLLMPLVVLSIVCHPDFYGWWRDVVQCVNAAIDFANQLSKKPDWNSFFMFFRACHELLDQILTIPTLRWLFIIAAGIVIAQLIWQARTGRTVGKWMCGLKVLRATLRPCGLPRSALRDVMLVIDNCFLLSWVPGVVSILTTNRSQRIGDRLADTIVIRLSNPATP